MEGSSNNFASSKPHKTHDSFSDEKEGEDNNAEALAMSSQSITVSHSITKHDLV